MSVEVAEQGNEVPEEEVKVCKNARFCTDALINAMSAEPEKVKKELRKQS